MSEVQQPIEIKVEQPQVEQIKVDQTQVEQPQVEQQPIEIKIEESKDSIPIPVLPFQVPRSFHTELEVERLLPNPNDDLMNRIWESTWKIVKDREFNTKNITQLIVALTVQVTMNSTLPLTKETRKAIIINLFIRAVEESDKITPDDKAYLTQIYIPMFLSGAIDSLEDKADKLKSCCTIV